MSSVVNLLSTHFFNRVTQTLTLLSLSSSNWFSSAPVTLVPFFFQTAMVFGLFSRKSGDTSSQPQQQLRTPSPSVVDSGSARVEESFPPTTPSPSPERVADPSALRALIQSVPPKTLHSYVLSQLATASPDLLTLLSSDFFNTLAPPPTLHCVRCHKGYFDVENNDRSCLIGHDDESAEVERLGKGAGYETLWGCCGKTVEGEGDMGPPDGFCFEGFHTTDLKRARFRADSTIHDDKLTSCMRLRCHDPVGRASRKRARRAAEADSDDSDWDSEDGASHSSVRTRSRATKKARTGTEVDSDEEMANAEASSMQPSPASISSTRKPRAKSVSSSTSARAKPAPKPRKPRSTAPPTPSSPSKKVPSTRFAPEGETPSVSASKIKGSMQPKSKPKSKQPKRLDEVVQSSVAGEIA
ncbi:hypothetical protein FB45DRAFT_997319 [Roridomyces roridus]|uniref:Uncharacterized protein n=1 Tax=Roridomyces roridus TaxID=1738132 RepID=A0AAD7FYD2_9AGAR|nr:hypothetical protein FB45DRAFT_997319 [Roridomyces roridus]